MHACMRQINSSLVLANCEIPSCIKYKPASYIAVTVVLACNYLLNSVGITVINQLHNNHHTGGHSMTMTD